MRSKTSFFNLTLFVKNITRFWPLWALYLVTLFFSMPMNLYLNLIHLSATDGEMQKLSCMLQCIQANIHPVVVFVFAILGALAVFSYLYSARNCNMIHAFPVTRGELFCTNYVSGLLFLIVPQILTFLITLVVCVFHNVTSVEYLFYWLLCVMGMSVFFYSMAVFFCMLTGNHFAAVVYYGLGNIVYAVFKMLILALVEMMSYGISSPWNESGWDMALSPALYLHDRVNINWVEDGLGNISDITVGGKAILAYLAAAVVLIILSLLLYRRRQLECAGDILSLNWLKPVFRWMAAFGVGGGFAIIFAEVFFYDRQEEVTVLKVCSIVFSFVFFFAAEMLIRKKFRVFAKKRCVEWIVCAAAIFVVLTAIDADWFGRERYVPKTEDIQAVKLCTDYDIVADSREKIDEIREIHRSAVTHKKEYESMKDTEVKCTMSIEYDLKDGRHLSRLYTIPVSEDQLKDPNSTAGKTGALQEDADTYLSYILCKNYDDILFTGGTYYLPGQADRDVERELTGEQAQTLFEAVRQDIEEGNTPYGVRSYEKEAEDVRCDNSLTLSGELTEEKETIYDSLPARSPESNIVSDSWEPSTVDEDQTVYASFTLYKTSRHTIDALIDFGIIKDESELVLQKDFSGN